MLVLNMQLEFFRSHSTLLNIDGPLMFPWKKQTEETKETKETKENTV